MTEYGADPWPTPPRGPYSPEAGGLSATTMVEQAVEPIATNSAPLLPPTVVASPPIVVSPEPTAAMATPSFVPPEAPPDEMYTTFGTPFGTPPPATAPLPSKPPSPVFEPTVSVASLVAAPPDVVPPVATDPMPVAQPSPPKAVWGNPPMATAERRKLNGELHWNWAAGCVLGLSILCLVFAGPRFAVAADTSQLGQSHLGDWLLYGAALGSLLAVLCLASRRVLVVAVLSLATAAVAMAAVLKLQGDWNLSHNTTWASLGLVIGLGLLGLGSSAGLRRRG